MSLWSMTNRRRAPRSELADELRAAARILTRWTVTGAAGVDLKRLLREAADEIERLSAGGGTDG